VKNIPVTLTPDCRSGAQFSIFDTLQAPIQTPVSPDGSYVGVAVLSLTTVDRACTGSPDHVAIIDTVTDTVVAHVGTSLRNSAGTHGANWGAKRAAATTSTSPTTSVWWTRIPTATAMGRMRRWSGECCSGPGRT